MKAVTDIGKPESDFGPAEWRQVVNAAAIPF
jgi:hypothetical protein